MSHWSLYHGSVSEVTPQPAETEALTIDELAQRTGMTARNIRAHQSRGLLPPPEVRGRIGFYGPEHIARIELIKELQGDGFNLEAIKRLLERSDGSSAEVLRFTQAIKEPFTDEEPEIVKLEDLFNRWQQHEPDRKLVDEAVSLGLLRPIGEGRFEEPSPRLGRVSNRLAELGIGPAETLRAARRLKRHADGAAKEFVRLFLEEVWKPVEESDFSEEQLREAMEALEALRPIASEAMTAMFEMVMTDRVEEAFGREMERFSR